MDSSQLIHTQPEPPAQIFGEERTVAQIEQAAADEMDKVINEWRQQTSLVRHSGSLPVAIARRRGAWHWKVYARLPRSLRLWLHRARHGFSKSHFPVSICRESNSCKSTECRFNVPGEAGNKRCSCGKFFR